MGWVGETHLCIASFEGCGLLLLLLLLLLLHLRHPVCDRSLPSLMMLMLLCRLQLGGPTKGKRKINQADVGMGRSSKP